MFDVRSFPEPRRVLPSERSGEVHEPPEVKCVKAPELMRILIVKPSSLGDIIQGLQIAQRLQEPPLCARIDWVVRDLFAPMVEASPAVSRVIRFARDGGWAGYRQLIREIRRDNYDVAIDLQGLFRSALLTRLARADRRLMHPITREFAGWLVPEKMPWPVHSPGPHACDCLQQVLPSLGLSLGLPAKLHLRMSELPPMVSAFLEKNPMVLFPDSRRPEKEWPYFRELTELLLRKRPEVPVLWAGAERCEFPAGEGNGQFMNLTARTQLREMIPIVDRARLIVANDSGPMHLAAALARPVVALFGPTPPERFGPYPLDCPRHVVLRAPEKQLSRLKPDTVCLMLEKLLQKFDNEAR